MPFDCRRQAVHKIDEFMDFSFPENNDNSVRECNIGEQNMKKCNIIDLYHQYQFVSASLSTNVCK